MVNARSVLWLTVKVNAFEAVCVHVVNLNK